MILGGLAHRLPLRVHTLRPVHRIGEHARDHVLAGTAIEREEVAVAACGQHHPARAAAAEVALDKHRRLRGVPIVRVVRRRLVVPLHLSGVDIHGDDRAREQVVAFAARLRCIRGGGITGAEDIEVRLRIVDAWQPRMTAAVARRVETLPRLEAGIARVHRHGVEAPLLLARFRIERHQISRRIQIVAGADDDVIADGHRRRRHEVLLAERRRLFVPPLFAGARVERHEIIVGRDEKQIVAPHRDAAIADVRAALRFPEVVPDRFAVVRVERPHIVRRRHVQDAVHRQHRAFDLRRAADRDAAVALAADARLRAAAAGRHLRGKRERQLLHVRLVDLRQRAVAPSRVVAGIRRPRIGEGLEQVCATESAGALRDKRLRHVERTGSKARCGCPCRNRSAADPCAAAADRESRLSAFRRSSETIGDCRHPSSARRRSRRRDRAYPRPSRLTEASR